MARKFLDAEEAAKALGVSVDTLNEMRERHELYPLRDGGAWKYKQEEIERLAAERAESGANDDGPAHYSDSEGDSILLSELELGGEAPNAPSTVIGKNGPSPDSDIKLAGSEDPGLSDVRLAGGSEIVKAGSGLSSKFDELDSLDLELPPAPGSSKRGPGSFTGGGSGILSLDDDELTLADEPRGPGGGSSKRMSGSSNRNLLAGAGSALDLAGDDDDLVLGGSGPGSDITHAAGDSGISLVDLSDSGISLDEPPPDLHGTNAGKSALNLSADDDDLILLEEEADPNVATQLKADDDFLLTPMADSGGEDSDSGSQVIALDAEGDFDESASTMLGGAGMMGGGMLLEEDLGGFGGDALQPEPDGFGMAPAGMPLAAPQPMMGAAPTLQVQEAPFSAPWVLFLAINVVLVALGGMMMYDLLRNMWSWDGPYAVNSSLMDGILDAAGVK
jgi:hypothetical protein